MQDHFVTTDQSDELKRLYNLPEMPPGMTIRRVFPPREPEYQPLPILHANQIIIAMLIGSGSALLILVLIAAALNAWR